MPFISLFFFVVVELGVPQNRDTYMHMYLLEFGLKQTLIKVLDPTTAIDFAIPTIVMNSVFSSLGIYIPYFMVYTVYTT